jgi:hypothetical protein
VHSPAQAKREEQLLEQRHARDAASASRMQEEAAAATAAAAELQRQMEVGDAHAAPAIFCCCVHAPALLFFCGAT